MMPMGGLLVILSGPSGTGKGSVRSQLIKERPDIRYAVSATTRPPRRGEVDGDHYFFLSEENFCKCRDQGKLCEWADVYGNMYGTPRQPMEDWLKQGSVVIAEKDVAGAQTLMDLYPEAVFVFMVPPTVSDLRERLASRGTESEDMIETRLAVAARELELSRRYDYLLINDELADTVSRLNAIITAELCRPWRRLQARGS